MTGSTADLTGSFWFPNNMTRILAGIITKNEDHLTINIMTPEDSAFINEMLTDERLIVIQGILNDSEVGNTTLV